MKLAQYMEVIRTTILEHDATAEVQAIATNDPELRDEFNKLKTTLLSSIRARHSVLGLRERREGEEPYSQEVDPRALAQHLALVRQDLLESIKDKTEIAGTLREAVQHLIGSISARTGVDIRVTTGRCEQNIVGESSAPHEKTDGEMETLMTRLRREGKIL